MNKSENLHIWEQVRSVPKEAIKPIKGGRMSGASNINPVWRIKTFTEIYGPCGIGWYYTISKQWLETGANNEIAAFCNIELFVKINDVWSMPISGTGGSSFVAKEKNGLYTSDECYKMALTDAISVAAKNLGIGADIYFGSDRTKYDNYEEHQQNKGSQKREPPKQEIRQTKEPQTQEKKISTAQAKRLFALAHGNVELVKTVCEAYEYKSSKDILVKDYEEMADQIEKTQKSIEDEEANK